MRTIYLKKSNVLAFLFFVLFCNSVKSQVMYNPSTPALGFNVFTQQNFIAKGGDTQGPVAVGNDLVLDGQTVFAMNTTGYYPTNTLNDGNNYGIVINGRITYTSGNSSVVNNGFLRLNNTTGSNIFYVDNNNAPSNLRITPGVYGSTPQISLQRQQAVGTATNANGINFSSAFTQLTANANKISTLSSGSCPALINEIFIPSGLNPSITLATNKINIINLSSTQLNNLSTLTFNNTPAANRIIIFNISAAGIYNWSNIPNFAGVNEANSNFMLWNFYNLTSLNLSGSNTIYGTLLAPMADIIKSNSANANGQIISKSFEMGPGEVHYYTFDGQLPDCPTGAPVALSKIEFTAVLTDKTVKINFYVAQEEAGDLYEIQRSFDGINFSTFKTISQNNVQNGKYELTDDIRVYKVQNIFYRIIAVSINRSVYSNIKSVKLINENALKIWPVPMLDVLNISFQSLVNAQGVVNVIDAKGTVVFTKNYNFVKGINAFLISAKSILGKGNYTIQIIGAEGSRFVKHFTKL